MLKYMQGFVAIPILVGLLLFTGAVTIAGKNAVDHPEVSQAGRK